MNKTKKRQLNIKNKLIAAIAMLLVSSIMMVSTTYAWFTLSTAPEVQGITTTVGANGNLEIALSPVSGNYNEITSGTSDANKDWVGKNLTWGNLLDLSDPSYRLDELTLLPSRLNITAGTATTPAMLGSDKGGSPLAIPVYGTDGRISELDAGKVAFGGYQTLEKGASGFIANNDYFGVRALGTSSAMHPNAIAFNNALSAMGSNTTAASNIVAAALNQYGSALADMAVIHATVNGTDTNEYVMYVDELVNISAELKKASASVETALYNALLALTKNSLMVEMGISADAYDQVKNAMGTTPLKTTWESVVTTEIEQKMASYPAGKTLLDAYNKWEATDAAVLANAAKIAPLATRTDTENVVDVSWSEVSSAMSGLMNTNHVTVSGYEISEVKANLVAIMSSGGVTLQLNSGSGVIANFGELTGNILASVKLSPELEYDGTPLGGLSVNIATTTEPAGGPMMVQTKNIISALGYYKAEDDNDSASIIDVVYGYAVDFVFRTNAANSNLLLQTEGAQRIYGDSTNAATMGLGSTITFSDKFLNLKSLVSMMGGIRVVFTNPDGEIVYGIAKIDFDETPFNLNLVPVDKSLTKIEESKEAEDGTITVTYKYEDKYDEGDAASTEVKLTVNTNGVIYANNILLNPNMGEHQYLVRELVEDKTTGEKYERWAVKTAITYTVTEETTVTPLTTGEDGQVIEGTPTTTTETVTYEMTDDKGNVLFYEDLDINGDGDVDYYDNMGATESATVVWGTIGGVNQTYTDNDHVENVYYENLAGSIDLSQTEETTTTDTQKTVIKRTFKSAAEYATAIKSAHTEPTYYHVHEQDVTLEGPLALHDYRIVDGQLVFDSPKTVQALTGLDQNVATGVTAMVYLDGDYVGNSDVINSEDGVAASGKLNLQFASSANLVPMQDTALMNGIGVKLYETSGLTLVGETVATKDTAYKFTFSENVTAGLTYDVYALVAGVAPHIVATNVAPGEVEVSANIMSGNVEILVVPHGINLQQIAAQMGITLPIG